MIQITEENREEMVAKAKELKIKSPHLMADDTLAQKLNEALQKTEPGEPAEKQKKRMAIRADKKFALIEFSGKPRETDAEIVSVGYDIVDANGEQKHQRIRAKRNTPIPVHAAVVDVLKNAKHPVAEQDDGQGATLQVRRRKIINFAPRYPFTMHCWLSEQEFNRLRKITHERDLTEKEVQEIAFGA